MKLQYKLSLMFVTLIVLFGILNIISSTFILKLGLEQQLISREMIGQESLEKRIFPYLANRDYATVTSILFEEKEIKKSSIDYIIIHDKNENVLAHTFLDEIPVRFLDHGHNEVSDMSINEINMEGINIIEMSNLIKEGDYTIGRLCIGYRKEYIENIENHIIRSIIYIVIILTFLSLVLSLFLSRIIVKPVRKLAKGMEEVSKGNLGVRLDVESDDEIGALTGSFRRMTEDLQKTTVSRDYVDNIIRSMFGTLIVVTPEGVIHTVNQAASDLLGYASEELAGKPVSTICAEWGYGSDGSWFDKITKEGSIKQMEITYLTKDGRKIPMLFSGSAMHDNSGRLQGIVCVAQDISERKEMEERLRLFSSAVEAANDCIQIVGLDGRIMYSNRAMQDIYGFSPEEFNGKHVNEMNADPDFADSVILPAIKEKGGWKGELMVRHKNGNIFPIWLTTSIIRDDSGTPIAIVGVIRDLTERKRSEEIRLENVRLTLAGKAKSEFLANMSHELRTPLNSIIGFSELMKEKTAGEMNEKQMHYVENVLMSGKHLLGLINDILDLSRVEAGKLQLCIEKVSIPDVVEESLIMVREKANASSIKLIKELDPGLDLIEADRLRLKQILFNLISNAIKFSKKDGGTVTVSAKKDKDTVKFSVSDTGIGIKEEDIGRLFREFEQLESGISRSYGGTGLGLAISKKLVELHGGMIWVESRYGEGSTFMFLLPIAARRTALGGYEDNYI